MVLANYVKGFADGVVGAENSPLNAKYAALKINYAEVTGDGRITLVDGSADSGDNPRPVASSSPCWASLLP